MAVVLLVYNSRLAWPLVWYLFNSHEIYAEAARFVGIPLFVVAVFVPALFLGLSFVPQFRRGSREILAWLSLVAGLAVFALSFI